VHLAVYSDQTFVGGGEKLLATLLARIDSGIDVTVVGTTPAVVDELAAARPGARARAIRPVSGKRDAAAIAAHVRAVRELRPDVLQTNGSPWAGQYGLAAGWLTPGVRTLAVHHIVPPPVTRGQLWRNRWNLRRADVHVSVFSEGARRLERWIGLPEGSVRVIHNGVVDRPVTPLPRPVSGPIIGTIGRLAPQKGQDVLLTALRALPGVTAVLVGDGPDREKLQAMARDLGVEDRVLMPGWLEDPRAWLPAFDVFVLPSRVEGLPLAIIEAMLASRPVVAASVDGIPEEVLDGRTGILVPPEDPGTLAEAVGSLLDDPDRRERMGQEGRRFAADSFSVEGMVAAYESLYDELLSRR
jgi:glycosyltransferase involved in cell wall biosynthesis